MKKIASNLILITLFMSGCSAKFSCGDGDKTSIGCQPLTVVSDKTQGKLEDYRNNISMNNVDRYSDEKRNVQKLKESLFQNGEPKQSYQVLETVPIGTPILSQPKVASIYFAPYKDEQGDLNGGGYIYIKVTDAEWVIVK